METVTHTAGPWTVADMWNNDQRIENGGVFEIEEAHYDVKERLEAGCEVEGVIAANRRLIAAAPELLEALQRILAIHCPLTGDPSHESLVAFWEHEQSEGRGEAGDQLFALAAIKKATGNA